LNLKATDLCKAYGLQLSIEYYDRFPETRNDADAVSKVQRACEAIGMPFDLLADPIRTSEDFGYFLMKAPGALIWLGAGEDVAPLHNAGFDYNDSLLAETCRIFRAIMEQ
ncbi:MAG: amidohydrolase, partial [Firmicutes bacterium]|nr:amidohydrolase [Bacillota bacterium]